MAVGPVDLRNNDLERLAFHLALSTRVTPATETSCSCFRLRRSFALLLCQAKLRPRTEEIPSSDASRFSSVKPNSGPELKKMPSGDASRFSSVRPNSGPELKKIVSQSSSKFDSYLVSRGVWLQSPDPVLHNRTNSHVTVFGIV